MEKRDLESIMRTIAHQEHSSILGGMQREYEELQQMGYVTLDMSGAHPSATITQKGRDYVASLPPAPDETLM